MKKSFAFLLLFLLPALCFPFAACAEKKESVSFYAMGAYCSVTVYSGGMEGAEQAVRSCENLISHRIPASPVYRLNKGESVNDDARLTSLMSLCADITEATNGKFSPFVLPLTSLWDFDGEADTLPPENDIKAALAVCEKSELLYSNGSLSLSGGGIDLGSAGKGFACEEAINECALENCVVSVGGSIGVSGTKNGKMFEIAIRNPFGSSSESIGVLSVTDCFISTSGSYEKSFSIDGKTYHHILDATTGYPFEGEFVSVTVVAPHGAESDILSTACFLLSEEEATALLDKYQSEGIFVRADGSISATDGLKNNFAPSKGKTVAFHG